MGKGSIQDFKIKNQCGEVENTSLAKSQSADKLQMCFVQYTSVWTLRPIVYMYFPLESTAIAAINTVCTEMHTTLGNLI